MATMLNDFISREAALEVLQSRIVKATGIGNALANMALANAMIGMNAIPAADVAPVVRGRWEPISIVVDDYSGRRKHGYECNKCGFFTQRLFNGCPMCFARMDGGEHHAE